MGLYTHRLLSNFVAWLANEHRILGLAKELQVAEIDDALRLLTTNEPAAISPEIMSSVLEHRRHAVIERVARSGDTDPRHPLEFLAIMLGGLAKIVGRNDDIITRLL